MMQIDESELEMVERHIREGEEHLASQRKIVASLSSESGFLEAAHELLRLFEEILEQHREHLARLLQQGREADFPTSP